MNYNFDTVIDRSNTNSLKYDFAAERGKGDIPDLLPLWVADMDFQTPVIADLQRVVAHGIFGYSDVKSDYADTVIAWFKERFGYSFKPTDIVKCPGVVYALATAVKAYSEVGDTVLIQTPVYYPFYSVITDNDRKLAVNPLVYTDGKYTIDFADFERKIVENNIKLFLLCSPHNPVGRVWTRTELEHINAICKAHNVTVVSDEIHCDFVWGDNKHTNYGLLDDGAVICTAPSKSFNLAGLQVSNSIIKNPILRGKFKTEIYKTGYSQLNTLGLYACQSAYGKHGDWLDELKRYLSGNIDLIRAFVSEHLPKVKLVEPEGTYLLWLDFTAYGLPQKELDDRILHGARLWLDGGTMFGDEGTGFTRVNIAAPRSIIQTALERLQGEFAPVSKY
jgi:cystathionine beta-lyase